MVARQCGRPGDRPKWHANTSVILLFPVQPRGNGRLPRKNRPQTESGAHRHRHRARASAASHGPPGHYTLLGPGSYLRSSGVFDLTTPFAGGIGSYFHTPGLGPKHEKMTHFFVNTEGLRPCWSKLSYGSPQWTQMVRLMQRERLKSPHKSLF